MVWDQLHVFRGTIIFLFFFLGGYTMGSLLFQFCAIECPFLIIACFSTLDGILRFLLLTPKTESEVGAPVAGLQNAKSLLKDPLILTGLGKTFELYLYI